MLESVLASIYTSYRILELANEWTRTVESNARHVIVDKLAEIRLPFKVLRLSNPAHPDTQGPGRESRQSCISQTQSCCFASRYGCIDNLVVGSEISSEAQWDRAEPDGTLRARCSKEILCDASQVKVVPCIYDFLENSQDGIYCFGIALISVRDRTSESC